MDNLGRQINLKIIFKTCVHPVRFVTQDLACAII
jgi:hypothetical protein